MPEVDLTKLTPGELKNLLKNCQRHGQLSKATEVIQEMSRRRIATGVQYRTLTWNQGRVDEVMKPFQEIAKSVPGNLRTAYTTAGGLRIGRRKDDPEHFWVDSYSAIKISEINAVFGSHIKRAGEEPKFKLRINGEITKSCNADRLPEALGKWRAIAALAIA